MKPEVKALRIFRNTAIAGAEGSVPMLRRSDKG